MPIVMGTAGHIDHGKTSLLGGFVRIELSRYGKGEGGSFVPSGRSPSAFFALRIRRIVA